MTNTPPETLLDREVRECRALGEWVRSQLYGVRAGAWRAAATTAVAATAAEEVYRSSDHLPQWQNATSSLWREYLDWVWAFLAGDTRQHYALSEVVAAYLTSPLNHVEGQDGPDDFDRPQTVAAYAAVLSAIAWGVDFAETAVMQIFDCIDLKFGGSYPSERWADVEREIGFVQQAVDTVARADLLAGRLPPQLIAELRRSRR